MALTLASTLEDLLNELTVRDQAHIDEAPTVTDFGQSGVQLNWLDGSKVRIAVSTMSITQDGVRGRPTVDLTDVPGGYNPNNPSSDMSGEIAPPDGGWQPGGPLPPWVRPPGPLENDIVPVRIPYAGPPVKNTQLPEPQLT